MLIPVAGQDAQGPKKSRFQMALVMDLARLNTITYRANTTGTLIVILATCEG